MIGDCSWGGGGGGDILIGEVSRGAFFLFFVFPFFSSSAFFFLFFFDLSLLSSPLLFALDFCFCFCFCFASPLWFSLSSFTSNSLQLEKMLWFTISFFSFPFLLSLLPFLVSFSSSGFVWNFVLPHFSLTKNGPFTWMAFLCTGSREASVYAGLDRMVSLHDFFLLFTFLGHRPSMARAVVERCSHFLLVSFSASLPASFSFFVSLFFVLCF